MIGKNNKKKQSISELDSKPIHTVVGVDIVFNGDIRGESIIRIDGKTEGNVYLKQGIILGDKAAVNGDMESEHIIVYGHITGNIKCKELIIKSSGIVNGNIETNAIEIEMGGKYNGTLKMNKGEKLAIDN